MGTWGISPFENDSALDFIEELKYTGLRLISSTLKNIIKLPINTYIEYDKCSDAWISCELIALSIGHDSLENIDHEVIDIIKKLSKKDNYRELALQCIPRISDTEHSELVQLWNEHNDNKSSIIDDLNKLSKRLRVKERKALNIKRPKKGDIILYPIRNSELFNLIQVVNSHDIIIYEGSYSKNNDFKDLIKHKKGMQIYTDVKEIFNSGTIIGNSCIRKELNIKKIFAEESCGLFKYYITKKTSKGSYEKVSYQEAVKYQKREYNPLYKINIIANDIDNIPRVRSPKQWENDIIEKNKEKWTERRKLTNPGPFGDIDQCKKVLKYMKEYSTGSQLYKCKMLAEGSQGYGRPNEYSERNPYFAMGLLAFWVGKLDLKYWPESELGVLPEKPDQNAINAGLESSKYILNEIITPDSELRFIWDGIETDDLNLYEWVSILKDNLIAKPVQ